MYTHIDSRTSFQGKGLGWVQYLGAPVLPTLEIRASWRGLTSCLATVFGRFPN